MLTGLRAFAANRITLACCCFGAFGAWLGAAAVSRDETPAAREPDAAVVQLDAVVTSANGRPVPSLKAADVELRIDGAVQPVESLDLVTRRPSTPAADAPPILSEADERREAQSQSAR